MALTDADLDEILSHCRDLLAVAVDLEALDARRGVEVSELLSSWKGPHADLFGLWVAEESRSRLFRARNLRAEADDRARVRAEAVNRVNAERREAAVEAERTSRGFGEQLVDFFIGDDSVDQVRPYLPVAVPTAATGFVATGGLERFG